MPTDKERLDWIAKFPEMGIYLEPCAGEWRILYQWDDKDKQGNIVSQHENDFRDKSLRKVIDRCMKTGFKEVS